MKIDTTQINQITGNAPLYHRYPGQIGPQQTYIELDVRTGVVTAEYNPEIGNAIPCDVMHGLRRRYSVPSDISASGLRSLVDDYTPVLQRVLDGASVEWNGSNHVCRLTDDAARADHHLDYAVYCDWDGQYSRNEVDAE